MGKAWGWLWARGRFWYGRAADWAGKRTLFVLVLGAVIATVVPALLPKLQLAGWLNWLLGMIVNYNRQGENREPVARQSEVAELKGRVDTLTDLVKNLYPGRRAGEPSHPPSAPAPNKED